MASLNRTFLKWIALAFVACALLAGVRVLAAHDTAAYAKEAEAETFIEKTVYIKGGAWGIPEEKTVPLVFDFTWLTQNCPTAYNSKLATFASLLSLNAYNNSYTSFTPNANPADNVNLLKDLGMSDAVEYAFIGRGALFDEDDQTSLTLAHRTVEANGKKCEVFFCVVDGTDGDNEHGAEAEWSSNFDIGADTDDYYTQTGIHPEWNDTANTKGVDIAAQRAQAIIDDYLSVYGSDPNAQTCMLICGHSRGGSISTILGAHYEQRDDVCSFTYTFSTPLTTQKSESVAENSTTVFTHVPKSDFFANVPFPTWGFFNNGTVYTVDIANKPAATALFESLTGHEFEDANPPDIIEVLSEGIPSREDVYMIRTETLDYDEETLAELNEAIRFFGTEGLSAVQDPYDPSTIIFRTSYQPLLKGIAMIIANRDNAEKVLEIAGNTLWFIGDLDITQAALVAISDFSGFLDAHEGATSYALAKTQADAPSFEHVGMTEGAKDATLTHDGYTGDIVCAECGMFLQKGEVIPMLEKDAPEESENSAAADALASAGDSSAVLTLVLAGVSVLSLIVAVFARLRTKAQRVVRK